ncbi:MAG: DNA mismatch repair endonuclease MutL [Alphaproteobacteria bacterium]
MSQIRRLPEEVVNRIAAGEVIERPASVAKEIVENALDAEAGRISLHIESGGKKSLQVQDNGRGMTREELVLAPLRYATSKLPQDDLVHIRSLGFRGEALAAIGAAGKLTITSRQQGQSEGWTIEITNGQPGQPKPAAANVGTKVELQDLFSNIPARLKFLRSDTTESMRLREVVQALTLSRPDVAFEIQEAGKRPARMPACNLDDPQKNTAERIAQVLGRNFIDNARPVNAETQDLRLHGFSCLPTYRRSNLSQCFFFVNGRPVRDRLLFGALRAAYSDLLPRANAPAAVLFLEIGTELVDVNVHPTKTEVRFQNPSAVRALIFSSVHRMLEKQSWQTATTFTDKLADKFTNPQTAHRPTAAPPSHTPHTFARQSDTSLSKAIFTTPQSNDATLGLDTPPDARTAREAQQIQQEHDPQNTGISTTEDRQQYPLGAALAQIHATYIVAQTHDSLILVDQHAADERLVYEAIKKEVKENGVRRQILLVPEVIELSQAEVERALAQKDELQQCGLVIEPFGGNSVLVREIPTLFARENLTNLVRAIADEDPDKLQSKAATHRHTHEDELPRNNKVEERIHQIAATIACHASIRGGQRLRHEEMNQLLRTMEKTPNSGQCNHGRPSYVELKISALDHLFERSSRKL